MVDLEFVSKTDCIYMPHIPQVQLLVHPHPVESCQVQPVSKIMVSNITEHILCARYCIKSPDHVRDYPMGWGTLKGQNEHRQVSHPDVPDSNSRTKFWRHWYFLTQGMRDPNGREHLEAERNKNCGEKSPGKCIQREIMRNATENKSQGTKNGEGIFRKVMHCTYKQNKLQLPNGIWCLKLYLDCLNLLFVISNPLYFNLVWN